MQVELGIDDTPSGTTALTGYRGDGSVDRYSACTSSTPCNVTDLYNAVAARVYVLARNTESTAGHNDTKTYSLGALSAAAGPFADPYKRHVYSMNLRIINMAGRREF